MAVLAFLSMMGAALLGLFTKIRLRSEHLQDDTSGVVRLVASIFVPGVFVPLAVFRTISPGVRIKA